MSTKVTTGYVRRLLSPKEILSALDLPSIVLRQASIEERERWTKELKVPFKGRFELLRSLGLALGGDLQLEPVSVEARTFGTRPLPRYIEEV